MANFEKRSTQSKKGSLRSMIVILLIVVFLGGTLLTQFTNIFNKPPAETTKVTEETSTNSDNNAPSSEPQFVKQGELTLLTADHKVISKIDIEIADKTETRTQGLMYRNSMKENAGMLFIFDNQEMQNFWMKNTHIPLDILFIDKDMKIVTIQKNTTPFSLDGVPSTAPAQYVLELNAGYSDGYKLKVGDYIQFKRL
jgi:uncharacterized membrane protein (UPF0127 family)